MTVQKTSTSNYQAAGGPSFDPSGGDKEYWTPEAQLNREIARKKGVLESTLRAEASLEARISKIDSRLTRARRGAKGVGRRAAKTLRQRKRKLSLWLEGAKSTIKTIREWLANPTLPREFTPNPHKPAPTPAPKKPPVNPTPPPKKPPVNPPPTSSPVVPNPGGSEGEKPVIGVGTSIRSEFDRPPVNGVPSVTGSVTATHNEDKSLSSREFKMDLGVHSRYIVAGQGYPVSTPYGPGTISRKHDGSIILKLHSEPKAPAS